MTAVALGAAGWALARAVTVLLANIGAPSFPRLLLPAKFTYVLPAGWSGSASAAWAVGIAGVLLFPFFFNGTWSPRRLLSASGLVKFAAAALLFDLVASAALIGSDLFTSRPWGGGASLPPFSHVILIVIAGLAGGALFALFGEGMTGGAPDGWIHPGVSRADVKRAFASGFLAAAVISLLAFVAADAFNLLFQALLGFLGESAEASPLGWSRLQLGLTLGLGLLLASSGALMVAMSPGHADRTRRLVSLTVAAVPTVALVALALWFKDYARTKGEMDTTLAQAAGLESAPPQRLMLLSGSNVYQYPMEVSPLGFSDEVVGATSRNIELADQYLRQRGSRWTIHTVAARHLAASVYDRLLEPEAGLRARADAAEATGSLLSTAVLLAKIPKMPKSDAVRDVSARLLDTTRFTGSQARIRLGADATAPRDRAVSGGVDLPADQRQGARVALYRQSDAKAPSRVPSALQLVAAVVPDARGRFVFVGMPPGFYSVGVLLPERFGADPKRVTVDGALRVVDVSKDRRADAGSLRVSLK